MRRTASHLFPGLGDASATAAQTRNAVTVESSDTEGSCVGMQVRLQIVGSSSCIKVIGSNLHHLHPMWLRLCYKISKMVRFFMGHPVCGTCCEHVHRNGRFISNRYGAGSGRIWLDNVQCSGTETSIANCQHNSWGSNNCQHSDDVSVSCYTGIVTDSLHFKTLTPVSYTHLTLPTKRIV